MDISVVNPKSLDFNNVINYSTPRQWYILQIRKAIQPVPLSLSKDPYCGPPYGAPAPCPPSYAYSLLLCEQPVSGHNTHFMFWIVKVCRLLTGRGSLFHIGTLRCLFVSVWVRCVVFVFMGHGPWVQPSFLLDFRNGWWRTSWRRFACRHTTSMELTSILLLYWLMGMTHWYTFSTHFLWSQSWTEHQVFFRSIDDPFYTLGRGQKHWFKTT